MEAETVSSTVDPGIGFFDQLGQALMLTDKYGVSMVLLISFIFYIFFDQLNKKRGVWRRKDEVETMERLKNAEIDSLKTENRRVHDVNIGLIQTVAKTAESKEATLAILQNLKPADDSAEGG